MAKLVEAIGMQCHVGTQDMILLHTHERGRVLSNKIFDMLMYRERRHSPIAAP